MLSSLRLSASFAPDLASSILGVSVKNPSVPVGVRFRLSSPLLLPSVHLQHPTFVESAGLGDLDNYGELKLVL